MEKGYYHASLGYWQTSQEPSEEVLSTYPSGYEEVPLKPNENYVLISGNWSFDADLYEENNNLKRSFMKLSFAQLLIGLQAENWITNTEAEEWLSRSALPQQVINLINQLPVEDRFTAKAKALGMSEAIRTHPLVLSLAALNSISDDDMDAFFENYSQS